MRLHIPRECESEMFSLRSRVPLFRDRPALMDSLSETEHEMTWRSRFLRNCEEPVSSGRKEAVTTSSTSSGSCCRELGVP